MKSRRFLKTAFFQLTVAAAIVSSCGSPKGNEGPVDLSPYLGSDGLYSVAAFAARRRSLGTQERSGGGVEVTYDEKQAIFACFFYLISSLD